jgi:hypothetical protein
VGIVYRCYKAGWGKEEDQMTESTVDPQIKGYKMHYTDSSSGGGDMAEEKDGLEMIRGKIGLRRGS